MDKYYFDSPIAYGVTFVPFSLEDTARCFVEWAEDDEIAPFDYSQSNLGGVKAYVSQVSAKREELPGLLKPQNSICRYAFVPTNSQWTAIFPLRVFIDLEVSATLNIGSSHWECGWPVD